MGVRGLVDLPGDPIDGTPVEFVGYSGGYPWVRADDGRTFVWGGELRPVVAVQLEMFA